MFERLKKLWNDFVGFAKDDGVIHMEINCNDFQNEHETKLVDLSQPKIVNTGCPPLPIDTEIAALVAEMNRVGIYTTCSCQGDTGQDGAYISIKVGEGTTYDYRDDTKELTLRWRRQ